MPVRSSTRASCACYGFGMSLVIKLVRHGESEANTGRVLAHEVGDHAIPLSERGREQAREVGRRLGRASSTARSSTRRPTAERARRSPGSTKAQGSAPPPARRGLYEDPRLREVEHGYEPIEPQEDLRKTHGWFYYRFRGGESPADCYDRTSSFLESLMRQVERKSADRVLIVTHGLTIRCFVMRFLHLSSRSSTRSRIRNCDVITLGDARDLPDCQFTSGRWGVSGLTLRDEASQR